MTTNRNINVVYIHGNRDYKERSDHIAMKHQCIRRVLEVFPDASIKEIESDDPDWRIPEADIYIGFSRGTRYFKKSSEGLRYFKELPEDILKISIGGIGGTSITSIRNPADLVHKNNFSNESLDAHFTMTRSMGIQLKRALKEYARRQNDTMGY